MQHGINPNFQFMMVGLLNTLGIMCLPTSIIGLQIYNGLGEYKIQIENYKC